MIDRKLTLFMKENEKVERKLAYRWIVQQAKVLGVEGGSVYRAIESFGEHGHIHEMRFYEISGFSLMIVFVTGQMKIEKLLNLLKEKKVHLFYTLQQVESGRIE